MIDNMYLRYPLPEHIKSAILQYGEDAYGTVVKYLVETFGLSRSNAQKPAREIIQKVLKEQQKDKATEETESIEAKKTPKVLSKEQLLELLYENKAHSNYDANFLDGFIDIYIEQKQNLDAQCDNDTLSLMVYRQCLFNPSIRNHIPDSTELRNIVDTLVKDLETAATYEREVVSSHMTLKRLEFPPTKLALVKKLLLSDISEEIYSIALCEVLPNSAFFPPFLLVLDHVRVLLLDLEDRTIQTQKYMREHSSEYSFSFIPPSIFTFDKTKESPYKNEILLKRFQQNLTALLLSNNNDPSVWKLRKNAFGRMLGVVLAQELHKITQDASYKLSDRTLNKIKDIVSFNFLDIFNFGSELISGSYPKPLRALGEKIIAIRTLLRTEDTGTDIRFGEKRLGNLSDREISIEIERVSQFNHLWKFLFNMIKGIAAEDVRTQEFLYSLLYGIIQDNFSFNAETRKFYQFNDVEEFVNEMLAYKNINRFFLEVQNELKSLFEEYRDTNLALMINNELFCIQGEEIYQALVSDEKVDPKNTETMDVALFILENGRVQKELVGNVIDFDKIKKILSLQSQRDQTLYTKGAFYFQDKFHYIAPFEFMEFLFRTIVGERFRDAEISIVYHDIGENIQMPLLITIENIVQAIPYLNNHFGQFFDVSLLFLVGEYIEFTHPNILNSLTIKEFIDVIRNYTIYPGVGFLKVSVIGKEEYVFIPLHIFAMSYGFESLISTTSTIHGRLALEYGSVDEWMPKIDMSKLRIKKFELPSLMDLLKVELGVKKTTSVETESYKIELGHFITDFSNFMQGKNVINVENDQCFCSIGEYPLHLINIISKNSSFELKPTSLAQFVDIVRLAAEGKNIDEFSKEIEKALSKHYMFIKNYPKTALSPTLAKLFELNIEGTFTAQEWLEKLPETEYFEDLKKEFTKLCAITSDISISIDERSLTFYVDYSINDLTKRLWANIIVADTNTENSWELSRDMKLMFYKEINQKVRSILETTVDSKPLYKLLFPTR